jgi:hypothetical protein
MLGKDFIKKSVTIIATFAVMCVYSTVALALPKDIKGEITVIGQVSVNGQTAVSNLTIASGSTITTGADSSATIILGKAGRVEVLADSSIMLKFDEGSIVGVLSAGKVRVTHSTGIATTIATKEATVIADAGQSNAFAVEIECSHVHVETTTGLVTMRSGNTDKQIAAGTSESAGNPAQTGCPPCKRPGGTPAPFPVAGLGTGALVALLLAAAGGVGTAIAVGSNGSSTSTGGGTTVTSPVR